MNKELLNDLESFDFVEVVFTTKSGKQRVMDCTRQLNSIPEADRDGINNPKLNGPLICCVFDSLNDDWRSFRWDSVISWKVLSK